MPVLCEWIVLGGEYLRSGDSYSILIYFLKPPLYLSNLLSEIKRAPGSLLPNSLKLSGSWGFDRGGGPNSGRIIEVVTCEDVTGSPA